jgi:hypothetical protein
MLRAWLRFDLNFVYKKSAAVTKKRVDGKFFLSAAQILVPFIIFIFLFFNESLYSVMTLPLMFEHKEIINS